MAAPALALQVSHRASAPTPPYLLCSPPRHGPAPSHALKPVFLRGPVLDGNSDVLRRISGTPIIAQNQRSVVCIGARSASEPPRSEDRVTRVKLSPEVGWGLGNGWSRGPGAPRRSVTRAGGGSTVERAGEAPEVPAYPTTVRLGASEVVSPAMGIGAWAWGDKFFWNDGSWSAESEKRAKEAYELAVRSGLGLIDTAEVYGTKQFGAEDSESLLGKFMSEGDTRALVATKFAALPWRFNREAVVAALKGSLVRLGVAQVDLYQIHWPGVWGNDGFVDGLADCVEQGLARAIGVSNFSEQRLRRAHAQLAKRGVPLASNQVHYNILYRVPEENGVKAACEELGVTLIAYSPLAQGMLSGKYSVENPPTGPRAVSYSSEYLTKMQPLLARMREIGEGYGGRTPVQVALNWLLSQGNIVPIPGAKNAKQVQEFAGALGWSLRPAEVEELRALGKGVPLIQGFPAEKF